MRTVLDQQKEQLPDAQSQVDSLQRQVEASNKIVEMRKKVKTILNQSAWAYVANKEKV